MSYNIAAIDIHKKVLIVVVAAVAQVADATGAAVELEGRKFGSGARERNHLVSWLQQRRGPRGGPGIHRPVLEAGVAGSGTAFGEAALGTGTIQPCAQRTPEQFRDAQRLGRRWLAGELMLSFVPEPEQRTWRGRTRGRLPLVRERVRLPNQVEALREEARIQLSSVVSDLLGGSGRRILQALSKGETDASKLAELCDVRLQGSQPELADALRGSPEPRQLALWKLHLEGLQLLDGQIEPLSRRSATALKKHPDVVLRLAEVPGFGIESAPPRIAEVGVDAEVFASAGEFASWCGVCPGSNVSAEENHSSRCPKGNR